MLSSSFLSDFCNSLIVIGALPGFVVCFGLQNIVIGCGSFFIVILPVQRIPLVELRIRITRRFFKCLFVIQKGLIIFLFIVIPIALTY